MAKDTSIKDRKSILKKSQLVVKWEALIRICHNPDYQEHLRPLLLEAQHNLWLDPDQRDNQGQPLFPSLKAFHKAYVELLGRARAYKEIQTMIDSAEAMLKQQQSTAATKKSYEF